MLLLERATSYFLALLIISLNNKREHLKNRHGSFWMTEGTIASSTS
jgi:hypothetical protein